VEAVIRGGFPFRGCYWRIQLVGSLRKYWYGRLESILTSVLSLKNNVLFLQQIKGDEEIVITQYGI
jgi:hypothetical protein